MEKSMAMGQKNTSITKDDMAKLCCEASEFLLKKFNNPSVYTEVIL